VELSLVIPCFNEEENVRPFFDKTVEVLGDACESIEWIFVNDGSRDKTEEALRTLCALTERHVRVIDFSRNFGKDAAILAGLQASRGDYTAIIDADLQQNPKYVLDMLNFLKENPSYDGACAYQSQRNESRPLSFFKNCFYKLINKITEIEFYRSASDFRVLSRKMVRAVLSMPERCRFSKGIFSWVGFRVHYMPYTVEPRHAGKTKWSFWKLMGYAVDGIVAFSDKPLILSSVLGMLLFVISLVMMLVVVIKTLIFGDPVAGFPTLASLILLLSGIQLLCIGIIGQYLAKIYSESKARPLFVIRDEFGSEKEKEESSRKLTIN